MYKDSYRTRTRMDAPRAYAQPSMSGTSARCNGQRVRGAPLAADALLQPCTDSALIPRGAEDALLADRCASDAAAFRVVPTGRPSLVHSLHSPRVAIATVAHRSNGTARFLTADQVDNATDVLPCAVILQSLAMREIGGFDAEIDYVLVHSGWRPEELAAVAAHGIKLHAGSVPRETQPYGSEFEAATMLKIDVAGLTDYSRVLYLDLDMLPRERAVQHLEFEYAEDLVTFPSVTSPVSGQLFVLRPDAKMHRLLRRLAATRASSFDVARGWAGSGLLTWPDADASNARAQCNSTAMRHGLHVAPGQGPRRRCALSPYWIRRCKRHALTNWNFIHAGSDQGVLWYAYNLSGLSSVRALTGKPMGPDGKKLLVGLPYWVHMQGMCKPWLATRETLKRAKCLKANAFFFHGVWDRFRAADPSLEAQCPTFARAYQRFVKLAPPHARKPCFWGGRTNCYNQYRPAWAASGSWSDSG